MKKISEHIILLYADSFPSACRQLRSFFENNMLVFYDSLELVEELSFSGDDEGFYEKIEEGLSRNQENIANLVSALADEGYSNIKDLLTIPQGYSSKNLHILAHIIDGFIGIDSAFYNLVDDNHEVSESLLQEIQNDPAKYWLITVRGYLQE